VRIALRPVVRHHILIPRVPDTVPAVALAKAALGDDGRLLAVIGSLGYRGLIVEATGGGIGDVVPRSVCLIRLARIPTAH
jgi:L-asparaginase